jgi:dihydrofolate reductase
MYPGYERYWTAIRDAPRTPVWITGEAPTPAELEWAEFAERTPHYVLSRSIASAAWPSARVIRSQDDVAALKKQSGKSIYLVGGGRTTASLIEAGLVDELRLLVYPLVAGEGKALFETIQSRRGLALRRVEQRTDGRASLIYAVA